MKKTIVIDGITYQEIGEKENNITLVDYVIVRTYAAGVFAGYLESKDGDECILRNARRLWYWDGAASLSQLAMYGVSKPNKCKFPCEVDKVTLIGVIEILNCTQKALNSIKEVPIWQE